jgi:hypothetical protein
MAVIQHNKDRQEEVVPKQKCQTPGGPTSSFLDKGKEQEANKRKFSAVIIGLNLDIKDNNKSISLNITYQ